MASTFLRGSNVFYDGLGSIVIEDFHNGQGLLSYDFEIAESVNGVVSEKEETTVDSHIKITCGDNIVLKTVDSQKFYVNESWVEAKDLKVGDELTKFESNEMLEKVVVTDIEVINESATAYTFFEILDKHVFFVERIMVHD